MEPPEVAVGKQNIEPRAQTNVLGERPAMLVDVKPDAN